MKAKLHNAVVTGEALREEDAIRSRDLNPKGNPAVFRRALSALESRHASQL